MPRLVAQKNIDALLATPNIKSLEDIKTRWLNIYEEKEAERKDYLEKAQAAAERMNEAIEAADQAYKKADMKAYNKAQEDRRFNADAMQMYKDKAADIEKKPYITRKEFDQICIDVRAYFDNVVESDRGALADIASQMVKIRDKESATFIAANDFLEFAQLNLLKARNGLYTADGALETFQTKKVSNCDALNFVNFVCSHYFIEDLMKDKK